MGQTANFTASGLILGQRQIAFGDMRNAIRCALQRVNHRATQHNKGDYRQHQRQTKGTDHEHQPHLGAGMRLFGQHIGTVGTDLDRLEQNHVIGIIQRTRRLIFMVDDGFKHAVFGIFQHRLHAINIGLVARFQFAIQRFIRRGAHTPIHISGKARLRLCNTFLCFRDVLFHRIHFRNTAGRTRMDHIDTRRAQVVRAV